jgi:hypothetical protein
LSKMCELSSDESQFLALRMKFLLVF